VRNPNRAGQRTIPGIGSKKAVQRGVEEIGCEGEGRSDKKWNKGKMGGEAGLIETAIRTQLQSRKILKKCGCKETR